MQTDALIGELLLRNNCVVIPKFGGFIATQLPASLDFASGKMLPPKKSILFNKQLTNSDGLLLSAYAAKNGCSYEEAGEQVNAQVTGWFDELHAGKRIAFDKVGYLYLDSEKNIRFEQDRFFNLLLQSFGMGQVQFVSEQHIEAEEPKIIEPVLVAPVAAVEVVKETPIIQLVPESIKPAEQKTAAETVIADETPVVPISKPASRRKIGRYVAAACFLPIAFYSVWIPMKTDVLESGMFSFHDFNPFHQQAEGSYTQQKFGKLPVIPQVKSLDAIVNGLPDDVSVFPLEFENEALGENNELFYIKVREKETQSAQESFDPVEKPVAEKRTESAATEKTGATRKSKASSKGRFKIIAGSFSNENNAQTFAAELSAKGFAASTMEDSNGLIRVIAGSSDSNAEANEIVNRLQQNGVASWILK